jgi:hypothetical protein
LGWLSARNWVSLPAWARSGTTADKKYGIACGAFVFVSERGSPASAAGLELKAHPHMLRHACAYAQHASQMVRRRHGWSGLLRYKRAPGCDDRFCSPFDAGFGRRSSATYAGTRSSSVPLGIVPHFSATCPPSANDRWSHRRLALSLHPARGRDRRLRQRYARRRGLRGESHSRPPPLRRRGEVKAITLPERGGESRSRCRKDQFLVQRRTAILPVQLP